MKEQNKMLANDDEKDANRQVRGDPGPGVVVEIGVVASFSWLQ